MYSPTLPPTQEQINAPVPKLVRIADRATKRFIAWLALLSLVVGAYVLLASSSAGAAPYNGLNVIPQCDPGTVNIPYPIEYYIEEANYGSDTVKAEVKAAYLAGAPTTIMFNDRTSSSNPRYEVVIQVWNFPGTSSASTGVEIPESTSGSSMLYVNDTAVLGFSNFIMYVNPTTMTVNNPPSYPSPSYSQWSSWTGGDPPKAQSIFHGVTNGDDTQEDCMYGVQNIYLNTGVTFMQLSEHEAEAENPEQGFWQSVGSFFGDFWDWVADIPQMIYDLFVPDPETMGYLLTEFGDFFSDKFGILAYPFEFFADWFGLLAGTSGINPFYQKCNLNLSSYDYMINGGSDYSSSTLVIFGGQFNLANSACAFPRAFPELWSISIAIVRALTVFALMTGILAKYRQVVRP